MKGNHNSELEAIISRIIVGLCMIFVTILLIFLFKKRITGYPKNIRYPVLLCVSLNALYTAGLFTNNILHSHTNIFTKYYCANEWVFFPFALGRLDLYYFWLGRLYTVFGSIKVPSCKVSRKHLKVYAISMFISWIIGTSLFYYFKASTKCEAVG